MKTLTIVLIVQLFEQWRRDASENAMRVAKVEKLVLTARVGESGDRSVRAQKALQQAARGIQSHRKSRKSGRREDQSPDGDEVISALRKAIENLHEKEHPG